MLRRIATDPLSVLGNVQEVLPLVQYQLHDYPALSAITWATATEEPSAIKAQITSEQYQAELARLEAAEAKRQIECYQKISLNSQLETLFEFWRLGGSVIEISSESLAEVTTYLETSGGKGYLGAICDCLQQEYSFRSWLVGEDKQPIAVDPNQLLMVVFEQWSKGLEASANERDFVAHYIQLAAGKGTLNALIEDRNEQQCFLKWLSQPEIVTV